MRCKYGPTTFRGGVEAVSEEGRESRQRLMGAALNATPDVLLYIRRTGQIRGLNQAGHDLLRSFFPHRRRIVTIAETPLPLAPVLFELIASLRQASESSPSLSGQGALKLQGCTLRYYAEDYAEKGRPLGVVLRLVPEVPRTPVPAEEAGGWPLTPRQRELVTLMARGRSTAQICSLLGISRETFKTHLRHVFKKTGAKNRVDLMVRVSRGRPDRA